ncbi:High-affinity choline uptake protein BetT [Rhodovulum sp. PH10]|uniref:BCCT family transporter n=1 Tax=Rhodovulum sp. PH10 TaxID=1187851 RepID=UPI00027C211C|nr:BCCT family transporter [Rhodovulum sp. PH10]EJW09355.1 High-affinity choline uptake protein BetT [Rhodovulum sp. PH10]
MTVTMVKKAEPSEPTLNGAPASDVAAAVGSPKIQVVPPVFYVSAALIIGFVLLGAVFTDATAQMFTLLQSEIVQDFGWFYIVAVAGFLIFVLFLMFSRYGDVRLGADDSEPEYSYVSWFAMLFSAGMGIGLIFFGVAEPIQHYASPPVGEGHTIGAARQAMVLTFFHWGLHAWAIYIVVGLALAYFAFRRGLPLTIRSALYPLIGNRIHGPIGHAIDIFAVFGTMFGIATSLGLGVLQIDAGIAHLFGIETGLPAQLVLITVITGMATTSVVLGLDRGVKRLSEINIVLAVALLAFVLVTGSTIFLLQAFVQNIGAYLGAVVQRTFRMYAYEPNPWLGNWTLFYWGWWIAWSPFVGMFIARISRGRTIREFVTGVLLVPVLFTFLWMTVFGNTAIALDLSGAAPLAATVANDLPVALFETLEHLPLATVSSAIAVLLIVTFFVTSADSGALVIDMITSGGVDSPPVWQRVFWAVSAGVVAAVLLVAGGLKALQTAAIASALPFAIVMVFICYGLLRALQTEGKGVPADLSTADDGPDEDLGVTWQQRLTSITHYHEKREVLTFLADTAAPALEAVAAQMRENHLEPRFLRQDDRIELTVPHGERGVFAYTIRARGYRAASFAWVETRRSHDTDRRHYRAIAESSESEQSHDVTGFTHEQIINDLLNRYARFRQSRRRSA